MHIDFKRIVAILIACGLSVAIAGHVFAGAITFDVNATVGGVDLKIGSIKATLGGPDGINQETGLFTFSGPWGQLDDCYDFRWFQIITDAPADTLAIPEFKFKDTDGNFTMTPTPPFVDQPAGGYSYQAPDGGADNDPFYENTDPGAYHIPNFSATHTEGVSSDTYDNPTPEDVYFETYLVATGHNIPDNTFCVLAGYSWNTVTEAGSLLFPDPVQIATIDVAPLQAALDNSGFSAAYTNEWTVSTDCELEPCPEPATWLLLAIGGVVMLGVRRARRRD